LVEQDERHVKIQVNGESRLTQRDASVSDLLRELDIRSDRVAVELNLQILDRKEFDSKKLQDGDQVEILSFIGGGRGGSSAGNDSLLPERAPSEWPRSTGAVESVLPSCMK
jgi:thiamine biosynthesis protein ThiS